MKTSFYKILFSVLIIAASVCNAQTANDISVSVNKNTGDYIITSAFMHWSFKGSTGHELTNLKTAVGKDAVGKFNEIKFCWSNRTDYEGIIKWYNEKPAVLFTLKVIKGSAQAVAAFPSFIEFPSDMHKFSYYDDNFAPPQFKLNETSTPWLFFDDRMNSFIISPASDFMVSKLSGDGIKNISSGLNGGIKNVPANYQHSTLLVFAKGIRNTWDVWGKILRALYKRKLPANDTDPILKYFGYWTDNGADYYYNYDTTMGYAHTLSTLRKRYKDEGIPLGYIQLDSWWYEKSIYDVNGKPDADHKNPKLPFGKWNRYGGIMSYTADPFLFAKGLSSFQKEIGLTLVTHSRWIDPHSPYHDKYKISGYAAVDPLYWNHIMKYLKSSGVICYEQDWLNFIYEKSPEMVNDINIGNEFTDGMANACKKEGLTIQYCMALPKYFLQGLRYNNLTNIRTSGDRFEPRKWKDFLYTSQLAYECGIYPWCDVFKSDEEGNMILSVLSAGPVGTGDAIGKENKNNILKACRQDGVLVKPDVPILPLDSDYINDAAGKKLPMLAYTFTKHGSFTTGYVFAFSYDSSSSEDINFNPSELGIEGETAVFNSLDKKVEIVNAGKSFSGELGKKHYSYFIVAPITASGIAFFGDSGKIAATGKKRIAAINNKHGSLEVKVIFAKGESSVRLEGYSKNPVTCDKGEINYNNDTHFFTLDLYLKSGKEVSVTIIPKLK